MAIMRERTPGMSGKREPLGVALFGGVASLTRASFGNERGALDAISNARRIVDVARPMKTGLTDRALRRGGGGWLASERRQPAPERKVLRPDRRGLDEVTHWGERSILDLQDLEILDATVLVGRPGDGRAESRVVA